MKADWVVMGGKVGESAHCTRCGEGLTLGTQRVDVWLAASKAFIKAHSRCKPNGYREPAPTLQGWAASRDTGISSATIFYVFGGTNIYGDFDVPHDPDDFGRCYRLLKLAPQWEAQLYRVSAAFPKWKPYVEAWPRLKEMYEAALQSRNGREMYDFMQALEKNQFSPAVRPLSGGQERENAGISGKEREGGNHAN